LQEIGIWVTPLLLLPGVALLVLSTSIRYGQIHEEVHRLLGEDYAHAKGLAGHLIRRATLFRDALVCLYIAVSVLAFAALAGAATSIWMRGSYWVTLSLTGVAILFLLYGSAQLLRESRLSLDVIRGHMDEDGRFT
jgi:hypothetical protein